jgi:hypothetical protein
MWGEMRDWLKAGGALPKHDRLREDLIGPETKPRLDGKINLESKEDMRFRGLPSPDYADSLCLSFAHPVMRRDSQLVGAGGRGMAWEDPNN